MPVPAAKARGGIAICDAAAGEDVGVKNLEGVIPLARKSVKIVKDALHREWRLQGSSMSKMLYVRDGRPRRSRGRGGVGGPEKSRQIRQTCDFGAIDALVEAAVKGVKGTLVITADMAPQAIQKLESAGVAYTWSIDVK